LDFTAEALPVGKPVIKHSVLAASTPAAVVVAPLSASAMGVPVPAAKPVGMLSGLAASYDATGASTGFTASKLFALEVDEVQHDPELEEASIRFANGDDGGAEVGLLEAVSPRGPRHQHEETWLTLFDLYRATSQYDRFESLAIDFASKFNRSSPMWFSLPEMVSKISGNNEPTSPVGMRKADWKCPANFGIQSFAALNGALGKAAMPWTLDWGSIQTIDDSAVAQLTKLFLSWTSQAVQLRMAHADKLEKVLREGAPSGVRTTDQERWNLLMAYLRVAHRPDEFELAALDFCVTYEVSPPSWEPARCEFKILDAEGNTGVGQTIIGDAIHDSVVSEMQTDAGTSMMTAQLASVELSGQIMGEPKPVLDKLEARLAGADMMIISCEKLVRVDFSAAGSLLNWVTARQAEGRMVQFTDVHRLVAAFFHVIGISEHAKVSTRID
jgi:ABC-type transporter Mla MlaB component